LSEQCDLIFGESFVGQEIPPPWTRDYRRMDSWGKKEKKEKMTVHFLEVDYHVNDVSIEKRAKERE